MLNSQMTTYYIKDSLVFSSKEKVFQIPETFDSFLNSKCSYEELTKENIMDVLEEYSKKGYREYTIYGIIDDFSTLKPKIEQSEKQQPSQEDYSFVEITSQTLVLNQLKDIVLNIQAEFPPENIIKLLDENEHIYSKHKKELDKEYEKTQKKYEEEKNKYKNLKKEEIEKQEEKKQTLEKEISSLKEEESEYEKSLERKTKKQTSSKNISSTDKQIEKLEFEKEKLEYDIELLQARVKTLKNQHKLGIKKQIKPLPLIATLGLFYWTKYSSTAHELRAKQLEILKKQEKITSLKKKIFVLQHERESYQEEEQNKAKKHAKEQEDLATSLENVQNKIAEKEEQLNSTEKELEKAHKKIDPLEQNLSEQEERLTSLKKELEKYSHSPKEEGFSIIKQIQQDHQGVLEEIEATSHKIENQTINYKGEAICSIEDKNS